MTCVIVLGTHRTGTSTVAGILHNLGVNMGDKLYGAHPSNPKGHFEDYEFLHHNNKVVGNWRNPMTDFVSPEDLVIYERLVEERQDQEFWGIKDPRLCITLRHFYGWLKDPVILCTHRDIESSAKSLQSVHGMSLDKAKAIQKLYEDQRVETLKYIKKNWGFRMTNVQYDDIIESPATFITSIAQFVGLKNLDITKAVEFVDPELRHY